MLKNALIALLFIVCGVTFGVFLWDLKDSIKHEYSAADKLKYSACIGGTVACALVVILGSVLILQTGWDFFMGEGHGTRLFG